MQGCDVTTTLRLALDDSHPSVITAAAEALAVLVGSDSGSQALQGAASQGQIKCFLPLWDLLGHLCPYPIRNPDAHERPTLCRHARVQCTIEA